MSTSRRNFLKSSVSMAVASAMPQAPANGSAILLKGGRVLSLDPKVGDFDKADVLIQGSKIMAVQPNIRASAKVIDASNMIVMPGFIDTHRHAWEAPLRNILPNGLLKQPQGLGEATSQRIRIPQACSELGEPVAEVVRLAHSKAPRNYPGR